MQNHKNTALAAWDKGDLATAAYYGVKSFFINTRNVRFDLKPIEPKKTCRELGRMTSVGGWFTCGVALYRTDLKWEHEPHRKNEYHVWFYKDPNQSVFAFEEVFNQE